MKTFLAMAVALGLASIQSIAMADTILWVDDTSGHIGQIDLTTDTVKSVITVTSPGFNLTAGLSDIAFTSSGTLYGSTFTNLFSINATTGAATNLGAFGSVRSINALVGDGAMLLGAASATTSVYSINPTAPGSLTVYAPSTAGSAGDLAFAGHTLYESGVSTSGDDELIDISTDSTVGLFRVGSSSGAALNDVLGLADDGTTMYATAGTEIYSVDTADGVLTPLFDYAGSGLTQARGSAFFGEASNPTVPEPSTLALFCLGLAGLGLMKRRKAR